MAALDDGTVLVLGALDAAFDEVPATWALAPGADAWQPLTPPPSDRLVGSAGVAVLDGVVHLVGGLHGKASVAFHSTYDPTTDS